MSLEGGLGLCGQEPESWSYPAPLWERVSLKTRLWLTAELLGHTLNFIINISDEVGQARCVNFTDTLVAVFGFIPLQVAEIGPDQAFNPRQLFGDFDM